MRPRAQAPGLGNGLLLFLRAQQKEILSQPRFLLRWRFLGLYLEMQSVTGIYTLRGGLRTHAGRCAKVDEDPSEG